VEQLRNFQIKFSSERKSDILTDSMLIQLGVHIPAISRIKPWELVFSINQDGTSMYTFYTKTAKFNPTILLIKDTKGRVFGAYVTEAWKNSDRFYGTGESFLFRFNVFYTESI